MGQFPESDPVPSEIIPFTIPRRPAYDEIMPAKDPYPGRPFKDAVRLLGDRFPKGRLKFSPSNGDVFISLPLLAGGEFRAGLTWQQAKYLAYSQLTGDDLKAGRLPADWPS